MRLRTALIAMLLAPAPAAVPADPVALGTEPAKQVHWAVGAFFGTGWYQVNDNRSVFILRIPPRQTVREAAFGEDGKRRLGVEIQYPLALGLSRLDDIPDFIDFENYSTISFTPGIQVEIPIDSRWSLRPYAHFGYGWETESQEGALIWYGGIKSRYRLAEGRTRWSLLNLRLGDEPLDLNWHLTYNWFFDELNFHVDRDRVESFRDQWELGVALGKRHGPIKIWFMEFQQIGLGLRASSNGKFSGLTLNFRSPFVY